MSARYAVFFAPDRHSPWREFGAHWLGRDEHDSSALAQPRLARICPADFARLTQEPRRYGFHATLKAPFRLVHGLEESALVAQLEMLARRLKPVLLGPLRVTALGSFVALVPEKSPDSLGALAAACVTELDLLRAPLGEEELARRRTAPLDSREAELLAQYGYPYVLERFRLHFTLTGPATPAQAQCITEAVAPQLARLNADAPFWLDRLCLFVERTPGGPFHRIIDLRLQS